VLDGILERLVEREESVASIVAEGFDYDTVVRIARLLNIAEYKRRQAAPGVKVTRKNFGRDRRYPIINKFRDTGKALPSRTLRWSRAPAAVRRKRSRADRLNAQE
jgi:NAD+ synthase